MWTWTAIDADSRSIPCWLVGTRDAGCATEFMQDLAGRLANRVQLTSEGPKAYLSAVEDAFGANIDYAMLVKLYGESPEAEKRYSPTECMDANARPLWIIRSEAHQYEFCGASEFEHENVDAPVHQVDEWILEEDRKSCGGTCRLLHVLQFRPRASDVTRNPSYGRWRDRATLGSLRHDRSVG